MDSAAERAVAKAEAAATRRRWITLAEGLAIAGVAIAALTLWTNWSDRRDEDAARKAEQAEQVHAAAIVPLVATPPDSGAALPPRDPASPEERRVGKEGGRACRVEVCPCH